MSNTLNISKLDSKENTIVLDNEEDREILYEEDREILYIDNILMVSLDWEGECVRKEGFGCGCGCEWQNIGIHY